MCFYSFNNGVQIYTIFLYGKLFFCFLALKLIQGIENPNFPNHFSKTL